MVRRKNLPNAINIQITLTSLLQGFSLEKNRKRSHLERAAFFHTTALSSSVAIRIDLDVLLTLVGQATYHIFAQNLRGYQNSSAGVIFRKFIDTPAQIFIRPKEIEVRLNKRANNPILIHSGFINSPLRLPWLQNKNVRITLR